MAVLASRHKSNKDFFHSDSGNIKPLTSSKLLIELAIVESENLISEI